MIKKILFLAAAVYSAGNIGAFATESASVAPGGDKGGDKMHHDHFTPEQKKAWREKKAALRAKHKERWEQMTQEEKDAHMAARKEHKARWEKMTPQEKAAWHKTYSHGPSENIGVAAPAE